MSMEERQLEPIGYEALIQHFGLSVMPHYRSSYISTTGKPSIIYDNQHETHIFSKHYRLKDSSPTNQLEFALKYDGVNLEIITKAFQKLEINELTQYIQNSPTGKYARIIWYLYEWLMGEKLKIDDVKQGNYVILLDDKKYYTGRQVRSRRHRVINNTLGNKNFCPFIRKTEKLIWYENLALDEKANKLIESYDPNIVARAAQYLFTKETISSYKIERETPSKKREERYVDLLSTAHSISELTKDRLIKLQQSTVEKRFANYDYRTDQNYVGETINPYLQKIHYISPKPNDLDFLMQGILESLSNMMSEKIHPIVIATAISFGFVFIHPFDDGNGRLHRFLIHYVLSHLNFTPEGIIFPVSAVMVENMKDYDAVLESFSKPLMNQIQYEQYPEGEVAVLEDSRLYYQYIDYTRFAEYLFSCVEKTIASDFQEELDFLVNYDAAKIAVQNIIDMPDRLLDLMIKFVYQNKGTLSKNKRKQYFDMLTDEEIAEMETAIRQAMELD